MQRYNARPGDTSSSVDNFNNLPSETEENGHGVEPSNRHQDLTSSDSPLELGEVLSQRHQRMLLLQSSIYPAVVEARGYRTVETKAELKRRGFSDIQCNVPGLLIPIYSPRGEISNYQFRPDEPRIKDGKPVKYETPQSSRMVLDVHPLAREKLGDPLTPLFITEGIKKGDALVSRGLCAVALLGAWNWRGTNERDGRVALPEWEHIALNGRRIYIVFDSDVMLKPQVHAALVRLRAFLEAK
jgi:hypothetical protein